MNLDWVFFGVTVYAVLMFELMVADAMVVAYDRVHRKYDRGTEPTLSRMTGIS